MILGYIYLDDIHKVCNGKFASLLGETNHQHLAHWETVIREGYCLMFNGEAAKYHSDKSFRVLVSGKN